MVLAIRGGVLIANTRASTSRIAARLRSVAGACCFMAGACASAADHVPAETRSDARHGSAETRGPLVALAAPRPPRRPRFASARWRGRAAAAGAGRAGRVAARRACANTGRERDYHACRDGAQSRRSIHTRRSAPVEGRRLRLRWFGGHGVGASAHGAPPDRHVLRASFPRAPCGPTLLAGTADAQTRSHAAPLSKRGAIAPGPRPGNAAAHHSAPSGPTTAVGRRDVNNGSRDRNGA